ncbi:MAG: TadE/TadG family type IV pilus assembly protein [Actinomycetota bacterium]
MTKAAKRFVGNERGAAAVEFALIAPLLFMLLFGIFEFGLVWSQKNVYVGAAREGARYAAVNCDSSSPTNGCVSTDGSDQWGKVKDRITNAAVGYPVSFSGFTVTTNPATATGACTTAGSQVKIHWTQAMSIDIPFLPTWNLSVPIEAVFRCE